MAAYLTVLDFLMGCHMDRVWGHFYLPFTLANSSNTIYLKHADDTQLYLSFSAGSTTNQTDVVVALERCISDIRTWMLTDKLKHNFDKTEFMLIGRKKQLSKENIDSLSVGSIDVALSLWQEI